MRKPVFLLLITISYLTSLSCFGQSNWKLTKEKEGIAVYQSESGNSSYKNIKVECTLKGTYEQLIALISNVSQHKDWVYNNKSASLIRTVSPYEFYYYTETSLPWPMTNRDAVMHTRITRDSNNRFLKINAVSVTGVLPEKEGKVRVKRTAINWYVTMPAPHTLHIIYTLEADPGGTIPAWMVNSFVDKGPFESFKKLSRLLK